MEILLAGAAFALTIGFALPFARALRRSAGSGRGLLRDSAGAPSPARLQGLLTTAAFTLAYFGSVATDRAAQGFPEIGEAWLLLLAGSGGTFLASKAYGGLGGLLRAWRG